MGEGIVYCHTCGAKILSAEFKKNRAIKLLGRSYCANCATKEIIEEAAREKRGKTADPPRPTTRIERRPGAGSTRRQAPRRKTPLLPIILGVLIAIVAIVIILWLTTASG